MKSKPMRVFLIVGLMLPLAALADNDCKDEDWPEGSAMHAGCIARLEFATADRQLNEVYKNLLAVMPPDEPDHYPKKTLVEAQRAWIKYRDASCALEAELTEGVRMWKSVNYVDCKARLTAKRTEELKALLAN